MEIVSFFRNIDLFGAHLINRVDKNQLAFRSPVGGIISFLIFSTSLAYAIWVFYLWGNNQYTAKISSSIFASDFALLDMQYDVVKINFWQFTDNSIDPFKEKILIPIVTYTQNYTTPTTEILSISNQTAYSGTNYIIPDLKLGFTKIDGAIMTSSEMFVQIVKCIPELLQDGEECAKQEIIDQFFSQPLNTIIMQIHYKQLDSKDGSLQSSVQEFLLQIETDSCYTLNTYLQTTFYEVRSSFLFGSPQYFEYINGALIQPQTNSVKYCALAYGYEAYLVMYIAMKGNQVKTIFEYPTAGDLFANIGSIVSLLFMIRHFITLINGYLLNHQLIHQIISFYYPQFSQIRIKRNWRRQIKKVYLQNELLDLQEFMKFYKNTYDQITHKLTFSNLHYEISRIYIILKSLRTFEDIKNSHHIGINLDYLLQNKMQEPTIKSNTSTARSGEFQYLTEDDITILSLQQREIEMKQQEKAQTIVNFHHRLTI